MVFFFCCLCPHGCMLYVVIQTQIGLSMLCTLEIKQRTFSLSEVLSGSCSESVV